jgi:hypothetical protein
LQAQGLGFSVWDRILGYGGLGIQWVMALGYHGIRLTVWGWRVNLGGGFLGMKNSTRMGCRSEYGGVPVAISIAVMPRDQMSACGARDLISLGFRV